MLRITSRDDILFEKINKRRQLSLKYSYNGDMIHVGHVSKGCHHCFNTSRNKAVGYPIYTGALCNVACGYCYYNKDRTDESWGSAKLVSESINGLKEFIHNDKPLHFVSYNSWGETLMYMRIVELGGKIVSQIEQARNQEIYSHLYTNGLLANKKTLDILKSINLKEIRFHVSASNFSEKVFKNMDLSKQMGFVVTVEEPSLPENKEKLIASLPRFEEIGVDHLDLVECEATPGNIKYLEETYPNGRIYNDRIWHIYDEGMAYDVMEEVIKNNYSFSALDCNSRVEDRREIEFWDTHPYESDYKL